VTNEFLKYIKVTIITMESSETRFWIQLGGVHNLLFQATVYILSLPFYGEYIAPKLT